MTPERLIIEHCAIATVDAAGTEYAEGHVVIADGRIEAVGDGSATAEGRRIDANGCLATPGLVNCHHHLYQWATRGLAQQATLSSGSRSSTRPGPASTPTSSAPPPAPAWRRSCVPAAARAPTTTTSSRATPATCWPSRSRSRDELHVRFHPCRGSMDLGRSQGGLPPDEVTEDRDAILTSCAGAIDRFHDPAPDAMVRIALAPCSPFSVTKELMAETATFARERGVRLHTHMAETLDEEAFCLELFGVRPVEYLEELGWLGDDVWLAHCVHLDEREVRRFGETGTGVAHCPSSNARLGAGIAPVAALTAAGAPVGLGVDGPASNEAGELAGELRQSLLMARAAGGPQALTAREALTLGTIHGARCLGRDAEIGSLEPGKLADVALWRLDGIDHAGIADPVAALVLGPRPIVDTLLVGGRIVVEGGHLTTGDEDEIARELAAASRKLQEVRV